MGGVLIGQAIYAAQQTVGPDFVIFRMSCTIRAPPDATKPLYYHVLRSSDRDSFAEREVKVEQAGTVFLFAECSFSKAGHPNSTVHHTTSPQAPQSAKQGIKVPPVPEIPASNDKAFMGRMVSQPERSQGSFANARHFHAQIRPDFILSELNTSRDDINPFFWWEYTPAVNSNTSPHTRTIHSWARSRGNMSECQASHFAVLGYLTDSWAQQLSGDKPHRR